ncbi:hypothetical protein NDU88_004258 [Pleurodeles waltl]|uniref:Uncharacterized protein n=1 Tax=Pleurodeles waltl TaxID=8319 RepID=A0AAV7V0P0_PLEWA|nr:hypothetical protein NDU88_004258 [Pleurodeles waltl]
MKRGRREWCRACIGWRTRPRRLTSAACVVPLTGFAGCCRLGGPPHLGRRRSKPTQAQAVEERSHALLEAMQFEANIFSTLQESQDSDPEQGDRTDSENSPHGPSLTPRSADDI